MQQGICSKSQAIWSHADLSLREDCQHQNPCMFVETAVGLNLLLKEKDVPDGMMSSRSARRADYSVDAVAHAIALTKEASGSPCPPVPGMTDAQQQLNLLQAAKPLHKGPLHGLVFPSAQFPARDVLTHLPYDAADAAVLFLGCADGCCLLASLAEKHTGLQKLMAVLNDHSLLLLARAALLLLLASELNPDSRGDMLVLWEVWYCALWMPATLARVKPFIQRLLKGRAHSCYVTCSVPWLVIPRAEDRDALQYMWSSWLDKAPLAMKVLKSRDNLLARLKSCEEAEKCRAKKIERAMESVLKPDGLHVAMIAMAFLQKQSHLQEDLTTEPLDKARQHDLTTLFDSGYLAPNYHGQEPAKPRIVNVTMLEPNSTTWLCRPDTSPVISWGPFNVGECGPAICKGGCNGITARLCIARITEVVRSIQAHTLFGSQPVLAAPRQGAATTATRPLPGNTDGRVQLQVQLVCMDALQLCLGLPLTECVSCVAQPQLSQKQKGTQKSAERHKAPAQATGSAAAAALPLLFDVVDTGLLSNGLGLLPVLVAAGTRLKPEQHARLLMFLYGYVAPDNLLEQIISQRMLHVPLSLAPTILGLCLLTDLTLEQAETSQTRDFRVLMMRELVWAPVPVGMHVSPLPQLQAQVLGGPAGSIEEALQGIASRLYGPDSKEGSWQPPDRSTPQLLAWLLASLTQRVDMSALLGADSSSSNGQDQTRTTYANTQQLLWALRTRVAVQLPAHIRMCFITGIDVIRSSLQQTAPTDWQPDGVPLCAGVLPLRVSWQLVQDRVSWDHGHILVDQRASSIKDVLAWLRDVPAPAGIHCTDMWAPEGCSRLHAQLSAPDRTSVYLPVDHGLHPAQTLVCLPGAALPVNLRRHMKGKPIQSSCTLAQLLLPSACLSTAARTPSSTHPKAQHQDVPSAQIDGKPWALHVLSLQEDALCYKVTLQLQPSKANNSSACAHELLRQENVRVYGGNRILYSGRACSDSTSYDQPRCSTAHNMVIELCDPAGQVQPADLQVGWPVATGLDEPEWMLADTYSGHTDTVVTVDPQNRIITVQLQKAQVWESWTQDAQQHLGCGALDLGALPSLPNYTNAIDDAAMFDQFHSKLDMKHGAPTGSIVNCLRFSLQTLMQESTAGVQCYTIRLKRGDQEQKVELYIKVYYPNLFTPACRPVLPCTVIDMSMCEGAICKGTFQRDMLDSLLHQLRFVGGKQPAEKPQAYPECCQMLRRMLARRAHACQPTAAQRNSLPGGGHFPYYYNSYVSYTHGHLLQYERVVQAVEPRCSLNHRMFMEHRLEELMAELLAAAQSDNVSQSRSVVDEIKRLVAHDKEGVLPAGRLEFAQMLINAMGLPDGVFKPEQCADEHQAQSPIACSADQGDVCSEPVATAGQLQCAHCSKQAVRLLRCSRCMVVLYCSKDCQVAHWKQHKPVCKAQLG